jgi:hypothetical protein
MEFIIASAIVTLETWAHVMNPTSEAINSVSIIVWAMENNAYIRRPVPNPTIILRP